MSSFRTPAVFVLVCLLGLSGLGLSGIAARARSDVGPSSSQLRSGEISVAALPPEARLTLERIKHGGPFPYERDGATFGNYEKLLPLRERGYYREYTVKTTGTAGRGARRIVVGRHGEAYYTADHYATFRRILE